MIRLLIGLITAAIASYAQADGILSNASQRSEFIRSARVWEKPAFDIGSQDLSRPLPACSALTPEAVITCSYKKPKRDERVSGLTPKFKCKADDGRTIKVKYGQDNAEVFTEVFSSRFLQALGYPTDCNYPVAKVICTDCPSNPDQYTRQYAAGAESLTEEFSVREFPWAMIEEKYGEEIVSSIDGETVEGFGFNEILDQGLRTRDDEQQLAREGLVLLMAILQHGDNRLSNQRLYCSEPLDAEGQCPEEARTLVVQDLGATLGGYKFPSSSGTLVNLPPSLAHRYWDFAPVWSYWRGPGFSACTAQVFAGETPEGPASLTQQKVSEEGRRFVADLLNQLKKSQLEQLAQGARMDQWIGSSEAGSELYAAAESQLKVKIPFRIPISRDSVANKVWAETLWKKIRSVTDNGRCRF